MNIWIRDSRFTETSFEAWQELIITFFSKWFFLVLHIDILDWQIAYFLDLAVDRHSGIAADHYNSIGLTIPSSCTQTFRGIKQIKLLIFWQCYTDIKILWHLDCLYRSTKKNNNFFNIETSSFIRTKYNLIKLSSLEST